MEKKQKVLVVDDEPRNQRIVNEILEGLVELKTASNGEEVLNMIDAFAPDLVLLDIMMPGINGYEVCKKIREKTNLEFTKVILVSGKAMVDERLQGYASGADDYMTKPFVPEELLAKAKVFLRLAKVETQISDMNKALSKTVQVQKTLLTETEAKLVTSAKMAALGEMAGGIAHEINTPLGTISMIAGLLSEVIQDAPVDTKLISDKINIIEKTVHRISKIVGGLRTFSRDGGSDQFDFVPLQRIIEDTLSLCGEKIKHNNIVLEVDSFSDEFKFQCRAVQISQVLLNLINNACDAILELPERWIKIGVEQDNDRLRIHITDSGNGISEEVREKLFQPFFTTKEIGHGTGLGLSISRGIVEAHHGKMHIDTYNGHTRFTLDMPRLQPVPAHGPTSNEKVA